MPAQDLSVLVFDEDRTRAEIIRAGLIEAGHSRVAIVGVSLGLARRIEEIDPDVIVIDVHAHDRSHVENIFELTRLAQRPVAMFVDDSDVATMAAAIEAGVSAYVVDGLRKDRVKAIVDLAIARFDAHEALRRELDETKQALADRKALDRAKSILMLTRGIDENEAHHIIRRSAMRENRRMGDVARAIIAATDAKPKAE